MENAKAQSRFDPVANCAALLSAVEVGLGSILHAFYIPFTGHFLSLNQAFLLTRLVLRNKNAPGVRGFPVTASNISAVLKSLSPAGKKLSPMLAISAQGLLYSIGVCTAGPNIIGAMLGSILLSIWAFLQPLMIYYVLFGNTIVQVAEHYYQKTRETIAFDKEDLILVLASILAVKALVVMAVTLLAARISDDQFDRYRLKLLLAGSKKRQTTFDRSHERNDFKNALRLTLRDVFNPLFIVSLVLTGVFFFYSEAGVSKTIWALLRPIAIAFVIFFLFRKVGFDAILSWLERTPFRRFAKSAREAARIIKGI